MKVKLVPPIEGLRVKDLLLFLENECSEAIEYLPQDYKESSISSQ